MNIKLSICIPTYNRAEFLSQTLKSIISQAREEIEIVISDNASLDDTTKIVDAFLRKFPRITYFRWDENMGADRNFLKVIELSRGEFCWFLGSDDIILPGGIDAVLSAITRNPEISGLSTNRISYSFDLSKILPENFVPRHFSNHDVLLLDKDEMASAIGPYLGYISAQVINRDLWNKVLSKHDVTLYCNAYVFVYIIFRMMELGRGWLCLSKPCVGWRSGNDSFLAEGRLKRLMIDVLGQEKIARDVIGYNTRGYRNWINKVATHNVFYMVAGGVASGWPIGCSLRAMGVCTKMYYMFPMYWIKVFPLFFIPSIFMRGMRAVYRFVNQFKRRPSDT